MLPSSQTILTGLSIASAVIAAASGIWGIAKELSTKSEEGDKQLTKAGKVAIALCVSSALIGAVTIGFRAKIEADAKASDARLTAQKAADERRYLLEEQNWRDMNDRQQKLFAQLGIDETRRVGGSVISNNQILAAIEEQRDNALAASEKLFQIGQSQRIVVQSQPIRSIDVEISFGGFSRGEIDNLVEAQSWVDSAGDRNDDYRNLIDARKSVVSAYRFYDLVPKLVETIVPQPEQGEDGYNRILVLDLDGTGSWVIPMGITEQTKARGFVVNRNWLHAMSETTPDYIDHDAQDLHPCTLPNVDVDRRQSRVTINFAIPANCVTRALHRSGDANPTVHLTRLPKLTIFRGSQDSFPLSSLNMANVDEITRTTCESTPKSTKKPRFAVIKYRLNGVKGLEYSKTLFLRDINKISEHLTDFDRNANEYGICAMYI